MKKTVKLILLGLLLFLCIFAQAKFFKFSSLKNTAILRFQEYKNKTQAIETNFGKLTYIDEGTGEPLLICHGICGGFDQAYDTAKDFNNQFRIIAPSRFGYPGSDLPKNATIKMQVQAFIELLDSLQIEKTYILATSAGSTSAIKFALMHPERTKGLILYCSGYPATEAPEKELKYAGPPSVFCHDFTMWIINPLFKPLMGMDSDTIKVILPMKDRKAGIIFDAKVTNTVMINNYQDYDLSGLAVPVLIIHAKDDKLANFNTVEPWISKIPDCTFVPLDEGGHLMTGNSELIEKAVNNWTKR